MNSPLKRRAVDKDTGLMIMVNTWLFGVGAVLVAAKVIADMGNIASFEFSSFLLFFSAQILEISTFSILMAGCFYSLVILKPDLARRKRERQVLELQMAAAEEKAYIDAFTGLHNHVYFAKTLHSYLEESSVTKTGVGLLFIEIENFRAFGHVNGENLEDAILFEIGAALTKTARDYDVIARIGVKKFAVLTPNILNGDLSSISARFSKLVSNVKVNDEHPPLKFSIGYAKHEKQTVQSFMDSADDHLKRIRRIGVESTKPVLSIAS